MRDLCLISVPHTGTRWCIELLTEARPKWHELGLNYHGRSHQFPHLYHGHCVKDGQTQMAIKWAKEGVPLIMPMRHPYRVEESWRRRGERDKGGLVPAYQNMLTKLLPHVSVFLPVDASPLVRAVAETKMNELVGRTLSYRWHKVVNSKTTANEMKLREMEPSDEIMAIRSHPVFTEFYGDMRDEATHGQS